MTEYFKDFVMWHISNIDDVIKRNCLSPSDTPFSKQIEAEVRDYYRNDFHPEDVENAYKALLFIVDREDIKVIFEICEELETTHPSHFVRLAKVALNSWDNAQ